MPFVRSLASKYHAYVVAIIFLLSKIMPTYSHCVLKRLVCVVIIAFLGCQPSSCIKCIKLNIRLSCNVRLVSNTKYIYFICFCILQSLRLLYLICLRVLYNSCCKET